MALKSFVTGTTYIQFILFTINILKLKINTLYFYSAHFILKALYSFSALRCLQPEGRLCIEHTKHTYEN